MPKKKTAIIETEDLIFLWRVFYKNWYILVVGLLVSFIISYFYVYKLSDIYAAKSQILLKNDATYNYQNQIYNTLGYYNYSQDNSNQIRILTSNDLISKTLLKLKFDVSYYIVGRLKTTEVYDAMPFSVSAKLLNASLYETDFKLTIINENEYELSYTKAENNISLKGVFNEPIQITDFFITIKKNDLLNKQSVKSLKETNYNFRVHNPDALIASYKEALTIENLESTTILELVLEDKIPSRAVMFLDSLSNIYIEYTAQSQLIINANTLDNIDKQLKEITIILNSIENDMEYFKSQKAILNLPRQEEQYFDELLQFDSQKRQLELYMQSLEALERYILTVGNSTTEKLLPPSFYIQQGDDYLKTAINQLYTLQMGRNEQLFNATESNRSINELDQNVELLRKNILTYITNSKNGLILKIQGVEKQIGEYTTIIKMVPKTQRDLLNIQRKLDVNVKMYEYLLEKRASTLIARAGILPETSIIEKAHSIGVVKPDKKKISYYFLLAGAIISLIIIFIRITFFSKIQSSEELRRYTDLPVIGEIAQNINTHLNYILVDKDSKAYISESFRVLRTNLQYMNSEEGPKIILITSYNPGEGKTFCSVNLSTIIAKASKKVLLIELDLHRPKVQVALNMSSHVGVSSVLIGKSTIENSILKTSIENMDVMLSGPLPPNPSEILLNKNLALLFEYGKQHYDYVIIDTAPVGLITDALVLMKHVNITLFILNTKFTNKKIINFTEEIVTTNKLSNFGLILNGVKNRKLHNYYNYGYGGYINDENKSNG